MHKSVLTKLRRLKKKFKVELKAVTDKKKERNCLKNKIISDTSELLDGFKEWPSKQEAFVETFLNLHELKGNFTGDTILEIGCDRKLICAQYAVNNGAKKVLATNLGIGQIKERYPKIEVIACDVTRTNFDQQFDFIFGRAVLEHITDIEALALTVKKYLKPGCIAYFDGSPMWDSPNGAHVWFTSKSGIEYTFAKNNPLKPYEHLMNTEDQLERILESRLKSKTEAREIVDYVYHSTDQNRLASDEIIAIFRKIGLCVTYKKEHPHTIPDDLSHYFKDRKQCFSKLVLFIKNNSIVEG